MSTGTTARDFTNWDGTVYHCRAERIEEGWTGEYRTIWVADNFGYYSSTYEDLTDAISYYTRTWAYQHAS